MNGPSPRSRVNSPDSLSEGSGPVVDCSPVAGAIGAPDDSVDVPGVGVMVVLEPQLASERASTINAMRWIRRLSRR